MNQINYQLLCDKEIEQIQQAGHTPSLLLHCCCAPCSSYVLEYLTRFFTVTVFYYNPNITPAGEYEKRKQELSGLLGSMPAQNPICWLDAPYEPERFAGLAKGMETLPEGGARCMACFRLRLEETARAAKAGGFDYFTTTLSISPMKNAAALNKTGELLSDVYGVSYLYADFKKRGGYQRSVALSKQYGLYRQNYCGCIFSKDQADKKEEAL